MNELREHRKNQKDNVSVAEREREREGRGRSAVVRSGFEFQIMHIHARVDVGREILREIHPRACIHLPALPSSTLMINKDVTIRGTINKTECGGKEARKRNSLTRSRGKILSRAWHPELLACRRGCISSATEEAGSVFQKVYPNHGDGT